MFGMQLLPTNDEVGELRRRASDYFAAQESQAAALHLFEIGGGGPLHRWSIPRRPHGNESSAARPFFQLPRCPRGFKGVAVQHVVEADEGMRFEESTKDRLRRLLSLLRARLIRPESGAVDRCLFRHHPTTRFRAAA